METGIDKDKVLSEKYYEVEKLREKVSILEKQLEDEMAANEHLHILNVELKGRLRELSALMKVRAHPSSMRALQDLLDDKKEKINSLREALEFAIRLIPDDRVRKPHLTTLKILYQKSHDY